MIYVLRTINRYHRYVKVGFVSSDLEDRMKSIQTGCPFKLELLAYKDGDKDEEKRLHQTLWAHRSYGEWFHFNKEVESILFNNGLDVKLKSGIKVPRGKNSVFKFLNDKFEHKEFPLNPRPYILDDFCLVHNIDPLLVEGLESEKSTFFIVETSPFELYEKLGYLVDKKDLSDMVSYKFIVQKLVYMHRHNETMTEVAKHLQAALEI